MFSLVGLQAKAAAVGAAVLVILGFIVRLKLVTHQRDKAVTVAETLKARHHVAVVQKKLKREEEKKLIAEITEIEADLAKDGEDFTGVEGFNDPNKF